MGGKVWSEVEERHFWRTAISQSPKRAGIDLAKAEKSWDQLAKEMQSAMGDKARRQYSAAMLFEHYFQNIETQRRSPNAACFVLEYLTKRDRTIHNIMNPDGTIFPFPLQPNPRRIRCRTPEGRRRHNAAGQRSQRPLPGATIAKHVVAHACVGPPSSIGFREPTEVAESIKASPEPRSAASSSEHESLFFSSGTDEGSELEEGEIRE
ncbi:hypothetical protein GGS21DRAFT_4574 [Xylaria nigripes]|nr:hypothetical protein GGS21DRAFT_4574 [Xylaria nigripes]